MSRNWIIGIVVVAGILVIGGLWFAFLRPPEEASSPIEAIPLDRPTEVDEQAVASESPPDSNEAEAAALTEAPAAGSVEGVFQIVQGESQVRFILGEILRGNPTEVVGDSDQVAGEIAFDPADPSAAQLGTILINARTLATDSSNRNRAIANRILESNTYEFITFEPTSIEGLPETITMGEAVMLQVIGDLTIRDITNEETFEVIVVPVSETRLEGSASTIVQRGTYSLVIPSVPNVADVDEEVLLEIDFVAISG